MKNSRKFLIIFLSVMITACSFDLKDPGKPWYFPIAGTELVLHQPVTIPPESASVYFQRGEITGTSRNRFIPYCKIEISTVKSSPQTILPDTFTIIRSSRYTDMISSAGLVFADAAAFAPIRTMRDVTRPSMQIAQADAPSDITETIQMQLSSSKQPGVMNLECGGAEDHPADARAPTFTEMKAALGAIMTFRLSPE